MNQSIMQLQQKIAHLRNDINQIEQICKQLQQQEQQNSQQLQQIAQREANAVQQLQQVAQTAQHMGQEVSQITTQSYQPPQYAPYTAQYTAPGQFSQVQQMGGYGNPNQPLAQQQTGQYLSTYGLSSAQAAYLSSQPGLMGQTAQPFQYQQQYQQPKSQ
ncbi:hypothetical protein JCM39194_19900 [Desulfotomaculum varum]